MAYLRATGDKALIDGNEENAKALFLRRWNKGRRSSDLIHVLKILQSQKDYNTASKLIKELPEATFKSQQISLYIASILRQAGEYAESMRILSLSLGWNNNNTELLLEMARSYSAQKKYTNVIDILEKIKDKNSSNFSVWFNLGVAYSNIGKLDEGLRAFTTANTINPNDEATAANRIVLLKETKQNI